MIMRTSNKTVYYPISRTRETELIGGSARVRYFRGSILVCPKTLKSIEAPVQRCPVTE